MKRYSAATSSSSPSKKAAKPYLAPSCPQAPSSFSEPNKGRRASSSTPRERTPIPQERSRRTSQPALQWNSIPQTKSSGHEEWEELRKKGYVLRGKASQPALMNASQSQVSHIITVS